MNNPTARGHNKFEAMKGLDSLFQEYMVRELTKEIQMIEKALKKENCWNGGDVDINHYRALESQRDKLLHVKEIVWRKRSRALWLKHGDRNYRFFHSKASQRRKTNFIKKLKEEDGY